jgi:hypothetical protein
LKSFWPNGRLIKWIPGRVLAIGAWSHLVRSVAFCRLHRLPGVPIYRAAHHSGQVGSIFTRVVYYVRFLFLLKLFIMYVRRYFRIAKPFF